MCVYGWFWTVSQFFFFSSLSSYSKNYTHLVHWACVCECEWVPGVWPFDCVVIYRGKKFRTVEKFTSEPRKYIQMQNIWNECGNLSTRTSSTLPGDKNPPFIECELDVQHTFRAKKIMNERVFSTRCFTYLNNGNSNIFDFQLDFHIEKSRYLKDFSMQTVVWSSRAYVFELV